MNIQQFKKSTSLHKFLDFIKQIKQERGEEFITITEHNWDNMCGIEIECLEDKAYFSFYDDGTFRCLIR